MRRKITKKFVDNGILLIIFILFIVQKKSYLCAVKSTMYHGVDIRMTI